MTTPTTTELLKYSELQMAAESFLVDDNGAIKANLQKSLTDGNSHASKFTASEATTFLDPTTGWTVLAQSAPSKYKSGFSGTLFKNNKTGELVISVRSTEFIDDAARDNKATNTLEIADHGLAFGQIADMEAWYAQLILDGKITDPTQLSVTGYSLGGHLATAFNLLRTDAGTPLKQVVTFNGAGIGTWDTPSLSSLIQQFNTYRTISTSESAAAHIGINDPDLASLYNRIRAAVNDGQSAASTDLEQLKAWSDYAKKDGAGNALAVQIGKQCDDVLKALDNISSIKAEVVRLTSVVPGDGSSGPKQVPLSDIEQLSLDYQMAVQLTSKKTSTGSVPGNLFRAYMGKTYGNTMLSNQFDVVGATTPSAVANSNEHYGTDVQVFIEDQPTYRGGMPWDTLYTALSHFEIRLLDSGYLKKDFGDTHSLVLLVDSLKVQDVLVKLMGGETAATLATVAQVLKQASFNFARNGDFFPGDGQGAAEGDALENVVNAMWSLVNGPSEDKLRGSLQGNTWHKIEDWTDGDPQNPEIKVYSGRNSLHSRLQDIQSSDLFQAVTNGTVSLTVTPSSQAYTPDARTDFGLFMALYTASPFVISGGGQALENQLKDEWGETYSAWAADRDSFNKGISGEDHKFTFSDQWISDRATFLQKLNAFGNTNSAPIDRTRRSPINASTYFEDISSELKIAEGFSATSVPSAVKRIYFGGEEADTYNGGRNDDHLYGGNGNDKLTGAEGDDLLEGGGGDDVLDGGDGDDLIVGGDGRDNIFGGKGADTLRGGKGVDRYYVEDGDTIIDDDNQGEIFVRNGSSWVQLQGGKRQEGETLFSGRDGTKYVFDGNQIDITTVDGQHIVVQDGTKDASGASGSGGNDSGGGSSGGSSGGGKPFDPPGGAGEAGGASGMGLPMVTRGGDDPPPPPPEPTPQARDTCPLVIDLDGDGIQTTSAASHSAFFDYDGDGFAEATGWVGARDALLVFDSNRDGVINSGKELLGEKFVMANGEQAADGFAALREFDGNSDGVVDSLDVGYFQLKVWIDSDGNGFSGIHELKSLSDAGINSISTTYTLKDEQDAQGNTLTGSGVWSTAGGQLRAIEDFSFGFDPRFSKDLQPTAISADVAALPDVEGYGTLHNLRSAIAEDASGNLKQLVTQFLSTESQREREALTDQITRAWAKADSTPENETLGYYPLWKLRIVEAVTGATYTGAGTGLSEQSILDSVYAFLRERVYLGLSEQGHLKALLATYYSDGIQGTITKLSQQLASDRTEALASLKDLGRYFIDAGGDKLSDLDDLRKAYLNDTEALISLESGGRNIYVAEQQSIRIGYGHNLYVGNAADDQVTAIWRNDVSAITGDGNDSVLLSDVNVNITARDRTVDRFVDLGAGDDKLDCGQSYLGQGDYHLLAIAGDGSDTLNIVGGYGEIDTGSGNDSVSIATTASSENGSYSVSLGDGDDTIISSSANVSITAGSGNDVINLSSGGTIAGGQGNDELFLGTGTYRLQFGRGDGMDQINSADPSSQLRIELAPGIQVSDMAWDLGSDGQVVLRILGTNDGMAFGFALTPSDLPATLVFADGTTLNQAQLSSIPFVLTEAQTDGSIHAESAPMGVRIEAPSGDNWLFGSEHNDVLIGGKGNDTIDGGLGADIIKFGLGHGQDVIEARRPGTPASTIIAFQEGIPPSDVVYGRVGDDLRLRVSNSNDSITIREWFNGSSAISQVHFDNGTQWSAAHFVNVPYEGTADTDYLDASNELTGTEMRGLSGNDTLYGGVGNDTLSGATGNDLLDGAKGGDTYVFERGHGLDTIVESSDDIYSTAQDVIRFDASITASDISLARASDDLILISSFGDRIVISGQFSDKESTGVDQTIERIEFNNGTVWTADTWSQIQNYQLIQAGTLFGADTAERFTGSSGDDAIVAYAGNDTLIGGKGNDNLNGDSDNDTYMYGSGDGADTIYDADGIDKIVLSAGIRPGDVKLFRRDDDLVVQISATDRIWIQGHFIGTPIETVEFSNGTIWTSTEFDLAQQTSFFGSTSANTITGTSFDDVIDADAGNDTITGGLGNDLLIGGTGSDTYIFGSGNGQDIISDTGATANTDIIKFNADVSPSNIKLTRDDSNLYLTNTVTGDLITVQDFYTSTVQQIEKVQFNNGTVWTLSQLLSAVEQEKIGTSFADDLYGSDRNDTLTGLEGADTILGNAGDDLLNGGTGDDQLDGGNGSDRYAFSRGDGHDQIADLLANGESSTLELGSGITQNEVALQRTDEDLIIRIGLSDQVTVVGHFTSVNQHLTSIKFSDGAVWTNQLNQNIPFFGTAAGDSINIGSAFYSPGGGVTVLAGAGNDEVWGGSGNDQISGQAGNDHLSGDTGNDTYFYALGDGDDLIDETAGSQDVLSFDSTVVFSQVAIRRDLDNLYVDLLTTGNTLTIQSFYQSVDAQIEEINFADGSKFTYSQLLAAHFIGSKASDILSADANGRLMDGRAGNDTLSGGSGNDTLIGGTGNDSITGDGGINTYIFNRGNGQDTLSLKGDTGPESSTDILEFGYGIEPEEVLRSRVGDDLVLQYGPKDSITINAAFLNTYNVQVKFANGTLWDSGYLLNPKVLTGDANTNHLYGTSSDEYFDSKEGDDFVSAGAGSDTIVGGEGTDHLQGGAGNDEISGGTGSDYMDGWVGNDIYFIRPGDGEDYVRDYDGSPDNVDTIHVGGGLHPSDVKVTRSDRDLFVTLPDGTRLAVTGFYVSPEYQIERLRFDDMTSVSLLTLAQTAKYTGGVTGVDLTAVVGETLLSGTDANDTLSAGAEGLTLDGGRGDDVMNGGLGGDTFIVDSSGDMVYGDTGDLVKSSVSFSLQQQAVGVNSLELTGVRAINATGTEFADVLVGNSFANVISGLSGADTLIGGAGEDTLYGGDGNDVMDGGASTDYLVGGTGSDTYRFGRNSDIDVIRNVSISGSIDKVIFDNDVASTDITVRRDGSDLVLAINDTDDELIIENWFASPSARVQQFVFSDGTTWSNAKFETPTGQDDVLLLSDATTNISGLGGNDVLHGGASNDTLMGGIGNDFVSGGDGNDVLHGDSGNDTLVGGVGDDAYYFSAGDGDDILVEDDSSESDQDRLSVAVASTEVAIMQIGIDLLLTLSDSRGSVLLQNWFIDTAYASKVKTIAFSDGVVLQEADILSLVLESQTGIRGSDGNDTLSGVGGSLVMEGGNGDDTYLVDDLADVILEKAGGGTDTVLSLVSWTLGSNVEKLGLADNAAINGTGNDLNNTLAGNSAANILDGGIGDDTLIGGNGNDTYIVDSSGDVVTENADEGTETIQSSITWTLGSNIENLTLTGTSATNGTGNTLNNILTGNSGDNMLEGAVGEDTLVGGKGNDMYVVDSTGDVVTEIAGEGTDSVQSAVTWILGANIENLTLIGTTAINGTGNALDNVLTGNSADNLLDGGANNDTLIGGSGNDAYVVDSTGDVVTEQAAEGTDVVQSSVTWTLGANTENLTLTGTSATNGTGNTLNNILTGNSEGNMLDGAAGDDTLFGGGGNDTYVVDSTGDVVTENVGEGIDAVQSSVTWTLGANIENLTLLGTTAINGTGNAQDNVLTGSSADNVLDGGLGNDSMTGGAGYDIYVVDNIGDVVTENLNEGTDTVQSSVTWSLGTNVENLTLIGEASINGSGNELNNALIGNRADNVMDGGAGNDTMIGGAGNDIYFVDSASDVVTENGNEGTDTIQGSVTYTLGTNVENLTLIGTSAINGTGNAGDNVLIGNAAGNTLMGGAGNDTVIGGGGNDTMVGGTGNDIYVVDVSTDVVTENANEGTDTIQTGITYSLASLTNVESLTLTGTLDINGTGNSLANVLTGNTGNNRLDGSAGNDTMVGGAGDDTYVVDSGTDVVTENIGEGLDSVQASITYSIATITNVENLTLTGTTAINATGNAGNNVLTGNSAANTLTGGAGNDTLTGGSGNDTMIGGTGDDTYIIDVTTDVITENAGEGTDTVQSAITFSLASIANVENLTLTGTTAINGTGNTLNNYLLGNSGANTLNGGSGADTLAGGAGNDSYVVDTTADVVTELSGEGTDLVTSSVTYTLAANVESLTLTGTAAINGTGNELANTLTGNSAANTLTGGAGNDTLSGGAGADALVGGSGDDTYTVDNTADAITELSNEGTDIAQSSVTYTLSNNVENLTLTGTAAINGTGNASNNWLIGNSAVNTLTGGAGNDTLNGGTGADSLVGGTGDDIYVIDNTSDKITENASEGTDLVQSSVTWTLGTNVENLTLLGTSAINGTGNTLDNWLIGNSAVNTLTGAAGNDTLDGGAGADSLVGGAGNDIYVIDNASDKITESASAGTDTVQSSVTWTLGANLENLTLNGASAINGTGNTLSNVLTGNGANNVLNGGGGNDTYRGGQGTDTLTSTVTASNDTYIWGRGDGADTLTDAGGADQLSILSGVTADQVWFRHVGNNLEVSVIGSSDSFTITGWYTSSANQVETFKLADGNKTLTSGNVQKLVDAMAQFSVPVAGQTTLPANYQASLNPVIAANWV